MISERVVEAIVYLHNEIIKKCVLFVAFYDTFATKSVKDLLLFEIKYLLPSVRTFFVGKT